MNKVEQNLSSNLDKINQKFDLELLKIDQKIDSNKKKVDQKLFRIDQKLQTFSIKIQDNSEAHLTDYRTLMRRINGLEDLQTSCCILGTASC